jgi:hypothetical protein
LLLLLLLLFKENIENDDTKENIDDVTPLRRRLDKLKREVSL